MKQAIEKASRLAAERATVPAIFAVQHCTRMSEVRAQIDALDDILVPLLVQRVGYMTQAARIKQDAVQVRDEARIQCIVDRVRAQGASEGGQPDVLEAIYRSMMEVCIAHEHREFARLRAGDVVSAAAMSADGPPQGASALLGGSAVRAATSVGAITP